MPCTRTTPRIHYEIRGEGPALVLHHGFSSSARAWEELGYAERLGHGRRLIMLDARGHGLSDKPREAAAYSIQWRVADVLAVLDDAGVARADFLGYSMGGWVGFGLLTLAPERVGRAAIGGAHPYADGSWDRAGFDAAAADGAAFIRAFEGAIRDTLPREAHEALLANDLGALAAGAGPRPDLGRALPAITTPTLLYAGEREARLPLIRRAASEMPAATLAVLPGLGHVDAFLGADAVLPVVLDFLGIG